MTGHSNAPKRRIALVTDAWRPQINGVVSCYEKMCELLQKRGYEVSVIHPGLFRTVPLIGYPEIRLAVLPKRRLKKMLDDLRPDSIHVAVNGPLGLAARAICRKRNIPFTSCYHTHFPMYLEARGMSLLTSSAYALLRRFHNSGIRTMVATESLKRELGAHGFKNLVLWPRGVDTDLFKRNPSPPLPALPKPVFAYMGRVSIEKNIEEFLKADLPGTKLIIGDGPDKKRLEKKYAMGTRFVGYKQGAELVDWLSLSDVFVFPSRTDTFGLVIIEALACGLPVAAHDVMGPRDIITNGVDGFLGKDLREAAMKCLELNRENCWKTAQRYSWEHSADAFLDSLVFAGKFQQ